MPTLDVFNGDAFSLVSMTDTVNKIPYEPGLVGRMGIFPDRGVTTTSIEIEEKAGVIRLIPTNPRGAPPFVQPRDRRTLRQFRIPQLQKYDRVYADQVQNIRSFGSETEVESVQGLVGSLLEQMVREIDVTIEHLRVSALQGVILDADGSTLLNLFTEFGVAQLTSAIAFTNAATDIRAQLVAIKRLIENEMGGTPISGWRGLASPEFFDALVGHVTVKDTLRYQEGRQLGVDLRDSFDYAGITFTEYRGSIDGTPFIPASTAWVFPASPGFGSTYYAPADFVETVNTVGLPRYSKTFPDADLNRWVSIYVQSNPLPILTRPRSVYKITMS